MQDTDLQLLVNSSSPTSADYRNVLYKQVKKINRLYKEGLAEPSTHYILPILSIRGEPMTLDDHFMFKPMFRMPTHSTRPKRVLFKTSRQVGKTYSVSAADILNTQIRQHWKSLFVTPLHEQIKKISQQVVQPMVSESVFSDVMQGRKDKTGVLEKTYKTGGMQVFSYAYQDSMRIRSITGIDHCNIDEIQHILGDHIPVIIETMSARPQTAFVNMTGTPLSFANPIEHQWRHSTMCEWVTKCHHCKKFNIPNSSHDLLDMIGKKTVVCARCKKAIDPKHHGMWVSPIVTNPADLWDRMHDNFAGFHVSQIIHPLHYNYEHQWNELKRKYEGGYTPAKFMNEVCGESYDSADRMITVEELGSACNGKPNTIEHALQDRARMDITALGIDWGGGGEETTSYTKVAVGGCLPNSLDVHIFYIEQIPKHWSVYAQVERLLDLFKIFRPEIIAHDFMSMGQVYEPFLLHLGIPQERLWNLSYTTAPNRPMIYYNNPGDGNRDCLNMDRTRSLSMLYNMIKAKRLTFPDWDSLKLGEDPNSREVDDFLSMHGEEIRRPSGHDVYMVQTDEDLCDDLVHAVNFLAAACWFRRNQLPILDHTINKELSEEDLSNICPQLVQEENYTV